MIGAKHAGKKTQKEAINECIYDCVSNVGIATLIKVLTVILKIIDFAAYEIILTSVFIKVKYEDKVLWESFHCHKNECLAQG